MATAQAETGSTSVKTGLNRIQYVRLSDIYGNGGYTSGLRLDGFVGVSAVPVPSSALLLITGLVGFLWLRRKTNAVTFS